MKVVIYESSSKGGCFEYSQYLHRACIQKNIEATLVVPLKASISLQSIPEATVKYILAHDQRKFKNRLFSRLFFLGRQIYNPVRFLLFLWRIPPSIVVWNDFEQLSAPLWSFLLVILAAQHDHVIILHDPDRDNYPFGKAYSIRCMKLIMSRMQLGLYHEYLPDKPYYKNTGTAYRSIIHGTYDTHIADPLLLGKIKERKKGYTLLSIIGNVREEKNYNVAMQALVKMPDSKLLIAGAPANSSINVEQLKQNAELLGVSERVYFEVKFLSDSELSACIQASDIILLYYRPEFTSQSGVLNLLAPYKKQFIYTDVASGLQEVCKKYNIGEPCKANDVNALIQTIDKMRQSHNEKLSSWEQYLQAANWTNIVDVIQTYSKNK
jgi:glycosyltransferase involved in cell wall biosynthesis